MDTQFHSLTGDLLSGIQGVRRRQFGRRGFLPQKKSFRSFKNCTFWMGKQGEDFYSLGRSVVSHIQDIAMLGFTFPPISLYDPEAFIDLSLVEASTSLNEHTFIIYYLYLLVKSC